MIRVSLFLAVVLPCAGAVGFWMNEKDIMAGTLVPPLLALIGTMGGGGALFVAFVVWAVMLRKRRA
jgi:hypothetical protein